MERKTRNKIDNLLASDSKVLVALYDGLKIYIVDKLTRVEYIGTFLPCAKNARKYKISADEIKETV